MERLTKRLDDGQAVMDCGACGASWHKKHEKDMPYCTALYCRNRMKDRLAAYEDLGLYPEEIEEILERFRSFRAAISDETGQPMVSLERAAEICRAEQAGRLVVLPCKVGSHVWVDGREAIVEEFFGYETERYLHAQLYDNMQYIDIPFDEIGKTVFLTREEAEAALKGGEG